MQRLQEGRRLDSWKEIAAFLQRDERTVTRWEKDLGMPVHRLPGKVKGRVYAYTEELLHWQATGQGASLAQPLDTAPAEPSRPGAVPEEDPEAVRPTVPASAGLRLVGRGDRAASAPDAVSATEGAASGRQRLRNWALWSFAAVLGAVLLAGGVAVVRSHLPHPARSATHTPDPAAQALYLQGRFQWDQRSPESLGRAVDLFTQAIVHDPSYANAYAGLADTYLLLREYSTMPDSDAYNRALAAAQKAVELDPSSAEAHCALGFINFYWKTDVAAANREFTAATQLDPRRAQSFQWYAPVLTAQGRMQEAIAASDRARELDPASRAILADRAAVFFEAGRDGEVRDICQQLIQHDPGRAEPHVFLSRLALLNDDLAEYASETRLAGELSHDPAEIALADAVDSALKQDTSAARVRLIETAQHLAANGQLTRLNMLSLQGFTGDTTGAMQTLRTMAAQHDPQMIYMRERALRGLSSNAEYQKLLRETGLPPVE